MTSVKILGAEVEIGFFEGPDVKTVMDQDDLVRGAEAMAALINKTDGFSADHIAAFRGMQKIVFFEGTVVVNGYPMTRPCCDEDDHVFYWEVEEFNRNRMDRVHANTFFHDCWHVVQFKKRGGFAKDKDEQVEREVDAIGEQIIVARQLGCSEKEIEHLTKFQEDHASIVARLAEGVDDYRMRHKD